LSKILLINGSPNKQGCTYTALCEIADTLEKNGVDSEILWLGRAPMQDCIACGRCGSLGKCTFDDLVNETSSRLDEFDGLVVGSPVYYAGPTGRLTSFLDRLFFSTDKNKLAGKLGACVVSCRRGGATAAFDRLNKYFQIVNMCVVGSQYWNQVHGFTPDDVRKDAEGLQTMRSLAANMAYLLKARELAESSGVKSPVYEARISTNFIR